MRICTIDDIYYNKWPWHTADLYYAMFFILFLFSRTACFWSNLVDKCATGSRNWICKGQYSLPCSANKQLCNSKKVTYVSELPLYFYFTLFLNFGHNYSARISLICNGFFGPQNCNRMCTINKCIAPVAVAICAPHLSFPHHFLQVCHCYFPFEYKGEGLWVQEL